MHEDVLRESLHKAVDNINLPSGIWENIQSKLDYNRKKRNRFRLATIAATSLVLFMVITMSSITTVGATIQTSWVFKNKLGAFTLTIVQNMGEDVAQITPTLFLPTTLSHAKKVAKLHIKLPSYLPNGVIVDAGTPTLVARFGSNETIAIKVTEKIPLTNGSSLESILLDIRQTTAKELTANYPKDILITTEKVKINDTEGLMVSSNEMTRALYWSSGGYSFRIFGPKDKEELLKIAESMK